MSNFDRVKLPAIDYNWIGLDHPSLISFDIGRLVPAKTFPVETGERVKVGFEDLIRFMPLNAPIFQRFDVRFDISFYPDRLNFMHSGDFRRGGNSGSTEYPYPNISPSIPYWMAAYQYFEDNNIGPTSQLIGNPFLHSLVDYFNFPSFDFLYANVLEDGDRYETFFEEVEHALEGCPKVSLLPFMAYQGLYRQWYRNKQVDTNDNEDQDWQFGQPEYWRNGNNWTAYLPEIDAYDLMNLLPVSWFSGGVVSYQDFVSAVGLGFDSPTYKILKQLFSVRNARFSSDYFTSALPSPLLPEVSLPVSNGEVVINGQPVNNTYASVPSSSGGTISVSSIRGSGGVLQSGSMRTNIDIGTLVQFREANSMQLYLEKSQLGGNGTEQDWQLAHFGVHAPDARLDMPEFIRRVKSYVTVSEISQTSGNTEDNRLGDFGGHAISISGDGLCDYMATEPGIFMIMMSVMPKQAYFQGMPKEWIKSDRFDFLIPEFAKIGMQPIDRRELFMYGVQPGVGLTSVPFGEEIFGYTDRYAEYKRMLPEIHGDFRSSLSYWHDSRMFANAPVLNGDFIGADHVNGGLDRIFNVVDPAENKLLALIQWKISIERPLPLYPRYGL